VRIDDRVVTPGHLGHLAPGRKELVVVAERPSRLVLLGGEPFSERILMWWNYVARSRDEVEAAHGQWRSGSDRFGPVRSVLDRIEGPATFPWATGP
jgi:redox-sensitive bicupin YhaK (pirin superfamily)